MKGASILVTGGAGAFGNAFVRRLLTMEPKRVAIYSRDEHKQEKMARELGPHDALRFFIGDVRSPSRLEMALRDIDIVVHAAAMKIVPTAEYNPTECVATNIGGAENVVRASLRSGVKRVLGLSTDKAVNPVNLYGATKLAAEKIFVAANALSAGRCSYSVMRYGNVCGSTGSVVPVFADLLKAGRTLSITDSHMTRFWITMEQAVDFALMSLAAMEGREIFVPKIPSVYITDVAKAMGAQTWDVTGIRPGEKIHETLISEDEARYTTEHPNHYVVGIEPWNNKRAASGWSYRSNTNKDWLDVELIRETIHGPDPHRKENPDLPASGERSRSASGDGNDSQDHQHPTDRGRRGTAQAH